MRTLLTILLTALLTLGGILGASLLLAQEEPPQEAPVVQTIPTLPPQTTAATQPPETAGMAETTAPSAIITVETPTIDTVPKYYQTDYPYAPYGNGTIATSGCGVTCLAMVSSYMTDQEYTPDALAHHFRRFGKNNIERLEHGNEQMQLPNVRTQDVRDALNALREGKVVIAMMGENSLFTSTQHFIVLAGMTEDGKILVNDPLEKTHKLGEDIYRDNSYRNGFGEHDIQKGFSGAWIYDKAAMGDFRFDATMPEQQENRYNGYQLEGNDTYLIASFLWVEARDQPEYVQQAIAEVILNRVVSPDFPNTVHDVIYQTELYSRVKQMQSAKVDYPQYRAVTAAVYGPYILPSDVYYFSQWEKSGNIWGELGDFTFQHSR